jgi:hypothetical protein
MAIINYTDQIKYAGKGYLDAKMMPVKTFDDLKAIPPTQRFEGLTVVVLNEGNPQDYWLIGGISNSCWKPKTVANFDELKLVLEEGFLKLMNAETQLGDAVDFNSFFPETDKTDLYIDSVDYVAEDDKGNSGIFMCFTYSDSTKKYLDMSQFLANTYEPGNGIVIDGNVISIDAAINGRIETIETNLVDIKTQIASKADITDVEEVEATLTEVSKEVEAISTNVNTNKTDIAALKERINALHDNVTIGVTDDEHKSLYVKILKKEGNLLSVGTDENGESGLCAFIPVFCEDEELNEE